MVRRARLLLDVQSMLTHLSESRGAHAAGTWTCCTVSTGRLTRCGCAAILAVGRVQEPRVPARPPGAQLDGHRRAALPERRAAIRPLRGHPRHAAQAAALQRLVSLFGVQCFVLPWGFSSRFPFLSLPALFPWYLYRQLSFGNYCGRLNSRCNAKRAKSCQCNNETNKSVTKGYEGVWMRMRVCLDDGDLYNM